MAGLRLAWLGLGAAVFLIAAPALSQTPLDDPLDARDAKRVDRMEKVVRELRDIVFKAQKTGTPVALTLLGLGALSCIDGAGRRGKGAGLLLIAAVLLQIRLGISTVHWGVPLVIATAHNAGAALLVISIVTLLRGLWPSASIRQLSA